MSFVTVAEFAQVILADIILSGDNALIIGLAAASLPPALRKKAIIFGMVMAAVLRIVFALFATYLLNVPGLLFVGGLLLTWVCWRLYQEIRIQLAERAAQSQTAAGHEGVGTGSKKSLLQALVSITVADLSMSIDNVLAVAAIARDDTALLVFGLALAIALMAFCATIIVRVLTRFPAISWVGLVILIYVAGRMLLEGWHDVAKVAGFV